MVLVAVTLVVVVAMAMVVAMVVVVVVAMVVRQRLATVSSTAVPLVYLQEG